MPRPSHCPGQHAFRLRGLLATMILLAGALVSGAARATAQSGSTAPVLEPIVVEGASSGSILVSGHGFTAGGSVDLVLQDSWGMAWHDTRSAAASTISYQPPQDLPAGAGFSFDTGGNIAETFHIETAVTWAVNGSQNPALGPVASGPTTMPGLACTASLAVRAHDRITDTWSNTVELAPRCASSLPSD